MRSGGVIASAYVVCDGTQKIRNNLAESWSALLMSWEGVQPLTEVFVVGGYVAFGVCVLLDVDGSSVADMQHRFWVTLLG